MLDIVWYVWDSVVALLRLVPNTFVDTSPLHLAPFALIAVLVATLDGAGLSTEDPIRRLRLRGIAYTIALVSVAGPALAVSVMYGDPLWFFWALLECAPGAVLVALLAWAPGALARRLLPRPDDAAAGWLQRVAAVSPAAIPALTVFVMGPTMLWVTGMGITG